MAVRPQYAQVALFSKQLQNVPVELRKELRPRIRNAAGTLQKQIQANASWSTRIPAATKVRVGFGSRNPGVTVFVDAEAAPHARPLEFGSQGRSNVNRHPVFGRDIWVDQDARPFFMPAVQQVEQSVVSEIQSAIDAVLQRRI